MTIYHHFNLSDLKNGLTKHVENSLKKLHFFKRLMGGINCGGDHTKTKCPQQCSAVSGDKLYLIIITIWLINRVMNMKINEIKMTGQQIWQTRLQLLLWVGHPKPAATVLHLSLRTNQKVEIRICDWSLVIRLITYSEQNSIPSNLTQVEVFYVVFSGTFSSLPMTKTNFRKD